MAVKGKRGPGNFAARATKAVAEAGLGRRKVGGGTEAPAEPVHRPRQQRIPGTQDARIDALEEIAEDYAAIRDKRQLLTTQEVDLKGKVLDLMKANNKEHYRRNGVEITIVHEEESVKVRVKKADDGE